MTESFGDLEPVTQAEITMVARNLGMIPAMICRIGDADISRGKAKIKGGRCLWTKDGRRIDIISSFGGIIASVSKEIDLQAPAAGTF